MRLIFSSGLSLKKFPQSDFRSDKWFWKMRRMKSFGWRFHFTFIWQMIPKNAEAKKGFGLWVKISERSLDLAANFTDSIISSSIISRGNSWISRIWHRIAWKVSFSRFFTLNRKSVWFPDTLISIKYDSFKNMTHKTSKPSVYAIHML